MAISSLGKQTRLNRIFSHPSGRILAIAVDHLINYPIGMPDGLRTIQNTLRQLVAGRPNSITMMKGIARHCMPEFAGQVPMIIQQMGIRADVQEYADLVTPEEVVSLGGDAIAVSIFVKGPQEVPHMRHLAAVIRDAERFGLPVIPHIYPIDPNNPKEKVLHRPEDIFYAVRVGMEMGADVIKVPYTGDAASFRDIVSVTSVPVVCAGGPKCNTLEETVAMVRDIAQSGSAGVTFGRNIWGFPNIAEAMDKVKKALYE